MTDKIDTSPEAVDRLSPYAVDGGCDAYGAMEEDTFGDYVAWEDYLALSDRVAELEAELQQRKADNHRWRGEAVVRSNELITRAEAAEKRAATLEAKLAKVTGALAHEVKRSRRHLAGSTLATLAEIQTETKGDSPLS